MIYQTSPTINKASQVRAVCWKKTGPTNGRSDKIGISSGRKGSILGGEETSGKAVL